MLNFERTEFYDIIITTFLQASIDVDVSPINKQINSCQRHSGYWFSTSSMNQDNGGSTSASMFRTSFPKTDLLGLRWDLNIIFLKSPTGDPNTYHMLKTTGVCSSGKRWIHYRNQQVMNLQDQNIDLHNRDYFKYV